MRAKQLERSLGYTMQVLVCKEHTAFYHPRAAHGLLVDLSRKIDMATAAAQASVHFAALPIELL